MSLADASPPPANEPGWYPDPLGRPVQRYYDGLKWTDRVSRADPQGQAEPIAATGSDQGTSVVAPGANQGGNWWSRRPRWAQWTIGIVTALVILLIGVAIGGSGTKEDELKDEIAALKEEKSEIKERAGEEISDAQAGVEAAELEVKAIDGKETEIVEAAEAKAAKIVGGAKSESVQLAGKIEEQKQKLSSVNGEVGSVEGKLSNLRGEVGEASQVAAKSTIPGSGIFQAEVDFLPGIYKSDGGGFCYWATLNSANTNDIADNENAEGPQIVTIETPYFETSGCKPWTRVSE